MTDNAECKQYYESSYGSSGFAAQRRYPNEELMRFLGREYGRLARDDKASMRVLEVGCGSGANLWAIANEGFNAYGIDLSAEGVKLCADMMKLWGHEAELCVGDMSDLPYEDSFFDAVIDVFSAYCLNEKTFEKYLKGVARVLRPGGLYFSYTPSKNSDAFKNHVPSKLIDGSTLNGISRQDSPFFGNRYPFRFVGPDEHSFLVKKAGMDIAYNETVGRTYNGGKEYFEFSVLVGKKN